MLQSGIGRSRGKVVPAIRNTTDEYKLQQLLLRENFERLKVVVGSFPLLAALVVVVLHGYVPLHFLILWYVLVLLNTLGTLWLGRYYQSDPEAHDTATWARIRVGSAVINALVWGCAAATVLYPPDFEHQVFILMLVGGTTGIAVTTSASYLPALFSYQAVNILPFVGRTLSEGHPEMSGIMSLYLFVLVVMGWRVHQTIRRSIGLELANNELLEQVQQVNQELDDKIQKRTSALRSSLAEREASEAKLARVHTLLEFSGTGVLVVDHQSLQILDSNLPARQLLSLEGEDTGERILRALQLSELVVQMELEEGAPQARLLDNLEVTVCRRGQELLVLIRDVSDRLQWEQRIHQAQKMQAVGRLAGEVAHDFNNLLMVISGHAGLITGSDAEEISEACQKGKALTSQLLSFSSEGATTPRVVELNGHIRKLDSMFRRLLGESIEVVTLLSDHSVNVRIDPGQLDQALLNLALNAREAMQGQGTLQITLTPAEDVVELAIQDSGPGVPRELRGRIFDPFFSTKKHRGAGLGLATSFGIIDRAGGNLCLKDTEQGACFSIRLPLVSEDAPEEEAPPAEPALTEQGGRLLVVEDQEAVLAVVSRGLRRFGYDVIGARSGEEAMEVLSDPVHRFDLVISDVILPKMSGLEVYRRCQERGDSPPFLLMSGYVEKALEGFEGEAPPLLRKPFKIRELLEAVQSRLPRGVVSR